MKKTQLLIIPLCFWVSLLNAQQIAPIIQKPILDTAVLGKWPKLSDHLPVFSSKGNYVAYSIDEKNPERRIFIIKSIKSGWQKTYIGATSQINFFEDETEAALQKEDSLYFITLGIDSPDRVVPVKPSHAFGVQQSSWITYKDKDDQLLLIELSTKRKIKVGKVSSFALDAAGRNLLYADTIQSDKGTIKRLIAFDLQNGQKSEIWNGISAEDVYIAKFSNNKVAFHVSNRRQSERPSSLWIYHLGSPRAKQLIQEDDSRIQEGFHISYPYEFSKDGKWLFFSLVRNGYQDPPKSSPSGVSVDVWSYKDKLMQPQQLDKRIDHSERLEAAVSSDSKQLRLLKKDESWALPPPMFLDDEVVIKHQATRGLHDPFGFYAFPISYSILSLKNGARKDLNVLPYGHSFLSGISPDGQWLIFYDDKLEQYLSYGLKTRTISNLTKGLSTSFNADYNMAKYKVPVEGIVGWGAENSSVLIYDNYDLWSLDASGHGKSINVTGGYGLHHHVKLRIIRDTKMDGRNKIYHLNDTLMFTGFDDNNKNNGFFRLVFNKRDAPELLSTGNYHYYVTMTQIPGATDEFDEDLVFVKASNTNAWIVKRQSATAAPNYFYTTDLRLFKPITNLAPQLNYNWLSAQLITYRQLDGTKCNGVLYKPENFDPSKKYPVIFSYYQKFSSRLNEFPYPEFMVGDINIPWFVSHGYLVFTPDIYFQVASISNKTPGENSYNSVIAAAHYLAKLPYVDKEHMGLQGHSFGAMQTNYLVSHSNIFAAASEMAGPSDPVSTYLSLLRADSTPDESRDPLQQNYEIGQGMMGATLWQRPDLYLKESTVLKANQIATPLLIVHNKIDRAVPWRQGVELYMALRRLKKPSWMLQYDGEDHAFMPDSKAAKDYTIRVTQFFDHYLKGYPPPAWMTRGIPAKMKGIETGYELDPKGECGPNCPICKKKDYKNFDPKLAVIKEFAKDPPPTDTN